jgi:phage regulator Rha-like protein
MHQVPEFQLVKLSTDGEPRASTESIAQGYNVTHQSTMRLLKRYQAQLETFGLVGFEIRARAEGQHGGGDIEYALINERQTGFLLSLMRNNKEVVAFKLRMSHAFWNMQESLHRRDLSLWERRIRLETKDASSKAKASIGSGLMLDRKRALPAIKTERAILNAAIQPSLLN